jgi:ribose/xylose/arabinose/galactoside ABC-type transport system permease subunit
MTMSRKTISALAMLFLIALAGFDLSTATLDPFAAPAAIALGSGQSVSGAHCAALPN